MTLCFDNAELADHLRTHDESGNELMRNPWRDCPALAPYGAAVDFFDRETVDVLRWQLSFSRERRILRLASLDANEKGILFGIVLPIMVDSMRRMHGTAFFIRLFERFTPTFVKRMLRVGGNALLAVLQNPWLNAVAIVVTKAVRLTVCFFTFGVTDEQWTHLRQQLLRMFLPGQPLDFLKVTPTLMGYALDAIRCVVTFDFERLRASDLYARFANIPRTALQFVADVMRRVAHIVGWPAHRVHNYLVGLAPAAMENRPVRSPNFGMSEAVDTIVNGVTTVDVDAVTDTKEQHQAEPYLRDFWGSMLHQVALALLLWLTRCVGATEVFTFLRGIAKVLSPLQPMVAVYGRTMMAHKGSPTLHAVVLVLVEVGLDSEITVALFELMDRVADMFHCLAAYFLRRIAPFIAMPFESFRRLADGADCCKNAFLEEWALVRERWRSKPLQGGSLSISLGIGAAGLSSYLFGSGAALTWGLRGAADIAWSGNDILGYAWKACDPRLKRRIRRIDDGRNTGGVPWYRFEWNAAAERVYGLRGETTGPMSTDVRHILPRAVRRNLETGYDQVDVYALVRYMEEHMAPAGRKRHRNHRLA